MGSHALPIEQGRLGRPAVPQQMPSICADAPGAKVCTTRAVRMSGIAFLIALILVIFGLNMPSCLMRHMVPCVPSCGTSIRRLFVL